jgi:transcriptional antiterminator NusG
MFDDNTPNNNMADNGNADDNKTDYDPNPIVIDDQELDMVINLEGDMDGDGEAQRYWYVVHCYSGYESKVMHAIQQRIETMGMRDRIFDVIIPEEEEIEIKDGKRKSVSKKIFPGYILVEMVLDEDSWYVVRNTPGVTGFVGMGNDPTPLRPDEVKQIIARMNDEQPKWNVNFKVGQKVRITGGPFNDFVGSVAVIDPDKAKVRVMVDFFGRETPVELDFTEVEAV